MQLNPSRVRLQHPHNSIQRLRFGSDSPVCLVQSQRPRHSPPHNLRHRQNRPAMVVAVAIVRVAMDAMVNASAGIAVNAVSAKIVRRDNLVSKDKTARHAVNATSAIARTNHASNVQTKPLMRRSRQPAAPSRHHQHKNRASNSNQELC